MQGRLLLAGVRIDDLYFDELISAAEAALLEPMLHGSMTSVDEILDKLADAIIEASGDPETFGTTKAAQASLRAAEELFPAAPVPQSEPATNVGSTTMDGPDTPASA